MVFVYNKGVLLQEIDETNDELVEEEVEVTEADEAIAELGILVAENSMRLDEQDAALVELAALITGGE